MVVNCYYLLVWVILFGLSGYRFVSGTFANLFMILGAPYAITNGLLSAVNGSVILPFAIVLSTLVAIVTIIYTRILSKKKMTYDKRLFVFAIALLCLTSVAAYQVSERSTRILTADYHVEVVSDEVNLYAYRPFDENSDLEKLGEEPTIAFSENYPRLDGATAAYPVYAAMAQELYLGLDENTIEEYVTCSTTDNAYERLINGEIDIFFGAQPSAQQIQAAEEKGLEFTLTPIAREAFVFIVNTENPVDNLTIEQIRAIYQKDITNWQVVGGNNETILPFQRPENSGSQTIMLAAVMAGEELPPPLWEEGVGGMGGMLNQVATYRNYTSAIGYTFRFYTIGMNPNPNIKLLAIDGIEPTIENIQTGAYPFSIDVYAVTVGPQNENTQRLIQWILSEQGQGFIETCGYVCIEQKVVAPSSLMQ
jgi:phosphate transport system substrate-binding protein